MEKIDKKKGKMPKLPAIDFFNFIEHAFFPLYETHNQQEIPIDTVATT
jgi:hypothetical protein